MLGWMIGLLGHLGRGSRFALGLVDLMRDRVGMTSCRGEWCLSRDAILMQVGMGKDVCMPVETEAVSRNPAANTSFPSTSLPER